MNKKRNLPPGQGTKGFRVTTLIGCCHNSPLHSEYENPLTPIFAPDNGGSVQAYYHFSLKTPERTSSI